MVPIAGFKIEDKRFRDLPVIAVRCARRLPAGAEMALVLGAQVKSRTGLARETPQRLAFQVRPAFIVKLTLPARQQGCGVPAGDADRRSTSTRRCRATPRSASG